MERMLCLVLVVCTAGYVHAVDLKGNCTGSTDQCSAGLVCQFGTCRAKIGSNCTTASAMDECVQNFTCAAVNTPCACPAGQVASANNTNCVINNIGGVCAKETECPANGICNLGKTCECKPNFVRSYDSTNCKKVVGQACSAANDCADNSECVNTTCACKTGFSVNGGRCAKTVGSSCTANLECSLMAECPAGTSRTCTCSSPYVLDTTTSFCKTGKATVLSGSILATLMLVMMSLAL